MSATKKSTPKATAPVTEAKLFSFRGIVRSFTNIGETSNRLVKFDTLNKTKTKTVQFYALLKDSEIYLAPYIKSKTVVEVQVKELPEVEGKRQFEIVSLMSELDRTNFNILLADAQAKA